VRKIFLASKKPNEGPSALCDVVANGAAQHGVARFESIEHGCLGCEAHDIEMDGSGHFRELAQVSRHLDENHGIVCTSTDNTAGRSRTIAVQLSPLSDEA